MDLAWSLHGRGRGEENSGNIRFREFQRGFLKIALERENRPLRSRLNTCQMPAPTVFIAADQAVRLGITAIFGTMTDPRIVEFADFDAPDFLHDPGGQFADERDAIS